MAVYFFDSSAIVKRYVNETGTTWVILVTDPTAGNRIHVARITGVEVVSAITRHRQNGTIAVAEAATALMDFRHDFSNQYRKVETTSKLVNQAMTLAETHALRGYDAVQLAAALDIHTRRLSQRRSNVVFVSADGLLNAAAIAEGLSVDDPNLHP